MLNYKYTLTPLMNRGQRATQLIQLIRSGAGNRRAMRRVANRDDFLGGPNSVARDGVQDAREAVYIIPSQFRHSAQTTSRRSLRLQGRGPSNIADPPYKVTMRNNIATSCNGPDHVFRNARCKHMIVAERLFRRPIRRSQRRLRPPTHN